MTAAAKKRMMSLDEFIKVVLAAFESDHVTGNRVDALMLEGYAQHVNDILVGIDDRNCGHPCITSRGRIFVCQTINHIS